MTARLDPSAHAVSGPAALRPPAVVAVNLNRLLGAAALIASLPLWLPTAAIVWTSLGRPLLFRQLRCGLAAKPYTICKFRTFHDKRDRDGELLPDAERVTPITRIMRALRIDELPQLISIARGEMAFVGPRPLLPATIAGFGELGKMRCSVLPGITGWAQINGNTRLTDRQKLALDLWYVDNRSLSLDLRILARTVLVILQGERVDAGSIAQAEKTLHSLEVAASTGGRR